MKPALVVVGSFVQDLTFVCDCFPTPGETTLGKFVAGPGGKGSNQAVAAARAGVATRFIGAVGSDAFAASARRFHRLEGIDSHLIPKPGHATAAAGIVVNRAGENQIVVAIGASAHLRPGDVPARLLAGARIVVAQHESNLATNAHVFRIARRAGATTVLNPAPMRDDFDPAILRDVDILIPNESEFIALLNLRGTAAAFPDRRKKSSTVAVQPAPRNEGKTDSSRSLASHRPALPGNTLRTLAPDELQRLCRTLGVPVVIVTLGERGCFVSLADHGEHLPAHDVKVIDTTGAGDAFVGGFAAGLVRFNGDTLAAARLANAVAALAVTKFGTAPAMPTAKAIERFMRSSSR